MYPSMIAMFVSGIIFLMFLTIIGIKAYNGDLKNFTAYEQIMLVLGISIFIGIHGIQHAYSEALYNYNPLEYKSKNILNSIITSE